MIRNSLTSDLHYILSFLFSLSHKSVLVIEIFFVHLDFLILHRISFFVLKYQLIDRTIFFIIRLVLRCHDKKEHVSPNLLPYYSLCNFKNFNNGLHPFIFCLISFNDLHFNY